MSTASLLICCTSPQPARGQELEEWLRGAMARFGSQEAGLYRARAEQPPDREGGPTEQGERMWFLAILGNRAASSSELAELLAEMRLLGLSPTVFHPGPLPVAPRDLASFF